MSSSCAKHNQPRIRRNMTLRRTRIFVFSLLTVGHNQRLVSIEASALIADVAVHKPRVEPQVLSLFPLGVSRSARSPSQVEVRGYGLEKAYAIWSDCSSITAQITAVEEIKAEDN